MHGTYNVKFGPQDLMANQLPVDWLLDIVFLMTSGCCMEMTTRR
jgi:hypothetical protein